MNQMLRASLAAFLCVSAIGCGAKSGDGSSSSSSSSSSSTASSSSSKASGSAAPGKGDAKVAEGGTKKLVLPALGLVAELAADSVPEVSTEKGLGTMVIFEFKADGKTKPTSFVVDVAGPDSLKTLEDQKHAMEGMGAKNVQSGTLPDGWWATYDDGKAFSATVFRKIGDKEVVCKSIGDDDSMRTAGLKACQSLKAT